MSDQKLVNEVLLALDKSKYLCLLGGGIDPCSNSSSNRLFICICGCGAKCIPCTQHLRNLLAIWKEVLPDEL